MDINRTIQVTNRGFSPVLSIAQGTDMVRFNFRLTDFDIPSGSAAVAYNIQPTGNIVPKTCSISGNTISVDPPAYYFLRGKNYMQIQITNNGKRLVTFLIEVWCSPNIETPEVVEMGDSTVTQQLLSEVGVMAARLNNLAKLEEGSTTGDAELQDIRVGYNGTTYESAGDAVRDSDAALDSDIKNMIFSKKAYVKDIVNVSLFPFEKGTYSTESGIAVENETHIRTVKMFPVPKMYYLKTNITMYVMYYTGTKEFLGYEMFAESVTPQTLNIPETAEWMNVVIGSPNSDGNLENVNEMIFHIYGSEYERGKISANMVLSQGNMQSTELNVSKDNRIIARMPNAANGTLKLYKNGVHMKDVSVGWNDYTVIENAEFYDFAILSSSSVKESIKNSVMFGGDTERASVAFDSSLSEYGGTAGEETSADQSYVVNPTDIYFLVRFPRNRLYTFSTEQEANAQSYLWSAGVLRLPKSYSHIGKKVPIAFFTHGTSGWVGNGAVQSQFDRCNYLVDNGIACYDINGWQGCYGEELPPNNRSNGQNMGNPSACACAHKAFEYIKKVYNVEEKCLVFGNSMGGLLALNYANNYRGDVLGCFLLYPVTDLKTQAWDNPWNTKCHENIINFYNMPDDTWEERCTYGYNPIKNNYAGIPIFIWHGMNDTVVSYQGSVSFATEQNAKGGSVYLRAVNGLGHGNYEAWRNIFETESIGAVNWFITTGSAL